MKRTSRINIVPVDGLSGSLAGGHRGWVVRWLPLIITSVALGCGTTRITDTTRTGTEQLLVSNAVDEAVGQVNFQCLAGKPVYFDPQYLEGVVDRGYLISSLRQHLLASGCLLQEDRNKATYVIEVRSGGMGTNRHGLLVGVPQMNVPTLVPGQPAQIPEIPLAKKTDQEGVAKIAVFAYNRRTGQPVWQSGVVQAVSTSKDTWVLGAGPFQQGTIRKGPAFAGEPIISFLPFHHDDEETTPTSSVPVTQAASWTEAPWISNGPIQRGAMPTGDQQTDPVKIDGATRQVLNLVGGANEPDPKSPWHQPSNDGASSSTSASPAQKPATAGKPTNSSGTDPKSGALTENEPSRIIGDGGTVPTDSVTGWIHSAAGNTTASPKRKSGGS